MNDRVMQLTKLQRQVIGLDQADLCEFLQAEKRFLLHKEVIASLVLLQEDARKAGFELAIVSAYRDFDRQLAIWNEKACGQRKLLDNSGNILKYDELNEEQKLHAILRWSAIPGTSRHHWGSDMDIFDASRMSLSDVNLTFSEVENGGPCAAMHEWLSERIANNESHGFFRPYQKDMGGVAPEKWHLSYLPISSRYTNQITPEFMLEFWQESGLLLFEELKSDISDIWDKFVAFHCEDQPYWVASA